MAANPMTAFLSSFAQAQAGFRSGRPDPLREFQVTQQVRQWDEGAPLRQAQTELTQANAEAARMQVDAARRQEANRAFGEAELRANQLGGLQNALGDSIFQQRLVRAVNASGSSPEGFELQGYERMNRTNLDRWGVQGDAYEGLLSAHNPNHQPGADDDEIIVPIYRHPDGTVGPVDLDGDGNLETYSAQEAMEMIRGQFVGSDEYAEALGSLRGPSPADQFAAGSNPAQPFSGDPASLAPPPELAPTIQAAAARHGVPENVLAAILHQESGYDPNAVNTEGSGATGIAQYMPQTAQSLGIDPLNAEESIDATAMQLAQRLQAGETIEEAVMHHFAGPNRAQWGERTAAYGQEVMAKAQALAGHTAQTQQAPSAVSADAMLAANQVAAPPEAPGSRTPQLFASAQASDDTSGSVAFEPSDPDLSRRELEQERHRLDRQASQNPDDPELQQQLAELDAQIQGYEELDALWAKHDNADHVREVAGAIPAVPGESGETTLGVPRDALPEGGSRGARRVAEGKGISPAQAKHLALSPEELPEPTPRATVAAGAALLGGLREGETGWTSQAGDRPTHKQLTTAVILNRAGLLDTESLTRFADLGVVSQDGVAVIQTGMQQAGQNQRQAMIDQRSLQQTALQQQGAMDRVIFQEQMKDLRAGGQQTFAGLLEDAQVAEANRLIAGGMRADRAEERSRLHAAKFGEMAVNTQTFRGTDYDTAQGVRSIAALQEFDERYNSLGSPLGVGARSAVYGGARMAARAIAGQPLQINMADNPLAVYLHMQGSRLMDVDERSWTDLNPLGQMPAFIESIERPMQAAAREMQMTSVLEDNPDLQIAIYDAAATGLRALAQTEGQEVLNDPARVQQAVSRATRVYLDTYTRAAR